MELSWHSPLSLSDECFTQLERAADKMLRLHAEPSQRVTGEHAVERDTGRYDNGSLPILLIFCERECHGNPDLSFFNRCSQRRTSCSSCCASDLRISLSVRGNTYSFEQVFTG
jgi:hypothetical protein